MIVEKTKTEGKFIKGHTELQAQPFLNSVRGERKKQGTQKSQQHKKN